MDRNSNLAVCLNSCKTFFLFYASSSVSLDCSKRWVRQLTGVAAEDPPMAADLWHVLLALLAILIPLLGAWLIISLPDLRKRRMRSHTDRQRR